MAAVWAGRGCAFLRFPAWAVSAYVRPARVERRCKRRRREAGGLVRFVRSCIPGKPTEGGSGGGASEARRGVYYLVGAVAQTAAREAPSRLPGNRFVLFLDSPMAPRVTARGGAPVCGQRRRDVNEDGLGGAAVGFRAMDGSIWRPLERRRTRRCRGGTLARGSATRQEPRPSCRAAVPFPQRVSRGGPGLAAVPPEAAARGARNRDSAERKGGHWRCTPGPAPATQRRPLDWMVPI